MDGVYRYQRHVYDLTRKYYLLGRDRLIDGSPSRRAAPCSNSAAAPAATWRCAAQRLSAGAAFSASIFPPACWKRPPSPSGAKACPAASRWPAAMRRISTRQTLFGQAGLRPRLHLLRPVDDPRVAAHGRRGARRARSPAARCTSSISAVRNACRAGSARRCAPGSGNSTSPRVIHCAKSSNRNPQRVGATLRFETLYRGYAVHAVLTKR